MKTAVVICPGRGTYNSTEIGVIARHFPDAALMHRFETRRAALGQPGLRDLDSADRFDPASHGAGANASALIFAASYGDFLSLDPDRIEVVAVTGNSMGWYTALTCAGAVSALDGFEIVNTMGRLMQDHGSGGQLVYPHMTEDWQPDPARKTDLLAQVADIDSRDGAILALSIDLGGMLVLAGNEAGLSTFESLAPKIGRFPMRLPKHAAFHTALLEPVAKAGRAALPADLFRPARLPLIDGRGAIWWPGSTDPEALRHYTLGHQVVQPYDFTRAITIAAQEFAPDYFVVTGPGTTLGAAVAQSLILNGWHAMTDKTTFQARQTQEPFLISMGRSDQRPLAARPLSTT